MAEITEFEVRRSEAGELAVNRSLLKTAFDRIGALVGLVLLSPFLLVVALLIKIDSPGPVLFAQQRHGKGGAIFTILKFRTMTAAASRQAFVQATANDVRVTRIGRFLRKTSIDELPQLINVLRGDMSLIGPRPHPLALDETYRNAVPGYMRRYLARPGLTGLAQVEGHRGETPDTAAMARRVRCDLDYVDNWTLWRDVKILLRSVLVLARGV